MNKRSINKKKNPRRSPYRKRYPNPVLRFCRSLKARVLGGETLLKEALEKIAQLSAARIQSGAANGGPGDRTLEQTASWVKNRPKRLMLGKGLKPAKGVQQVSPVKEIKRVDLPTQIKKKLKPLYLEECIQARSEFLKSMLDMPLKVQEARMIHVGHMDNMIEQLWRQRRLTKHTN